MAYKPYGSKYHAKKTKVDGITFDSKKEAERYLELKAMEQAGEISCLLRQKAFVLIPTQYEYFERYGVKGQKLKDGRKLLESQCTYRADFVYNLPSGEMVVEDVKGFKTPEYKIKRKLMLERYGIRIHEV